MLGFLCPPTEQQRVAALEAHHGLVLMGQGLERLVDDSTWVSVRSPGRLPTSISMECLRRDNRQDLSSPQGGRE